MKQQDFWCKLYNKCFGNNYVLRKIRVYSIARYLVCCCANKLLAYKFANRNFTLINDNKRSPRIVISLTSFPARINTIWITISSLLEQSVRPDKIILWLSKKQFSSKEELPSELIRLENFGLDIRLVDEDIRSHKKFYYSFAEFRNDLVLLVDDDIIYPSDTIERLFEKWISLTGKRVICSYGSVIQYTESGQRIRYDSWPEITTKETHPNLFFGSGGGTLIRPSDLYEDVLNKELFLKLTPLADDIWLNAMCRLGGVKVYRERFYNILPVRIKGNVTLSSVNLLECKNDEQLELVDEYYNHKIGMAPFKRVDSSL